MCYQPNVYPFQIDIFLTKKYEFINSQKIDLSFKPLSQLEVINSTVNHSSIPATEAGMVIFIKLWE